MSDLLKVMVNGEVIEVPANYTLLQACEAAGEEIPRFCFHERLSVAGNCRMCLVEVKGGPPKPQASCALSISDLRPGPDGQPPEIYTNTPMVKKAREGVMEFLLINHPLDCPICDQGGECDLQDQAMAYGVDKSRYELNKRAVEEKYMGPLIKTTMTRCIQCTRCVRFSTEVAGIPEIGAIGRGENLEITTYLEQAVTSELSGNVIDLCPVGALTSEPYEFTARPWELQKTETIDVMDAMGAAIRVDARGSEVMRIMPRTNDAINEEWLSDKSRFIWDGLKSQRLDQPYVREDGTLKPASWDKAFRTIAAKMKEAGGEKIAALAGDLADVESLFALKELFDALGSPHRDCRQDEAGLPVEARAHYLFNTSFEGLEEADAILMIGTNPRHEAAVLNARIRKTWLSSDVKIGMIGEAVDLTYPYEHLGSGPATLGDVISGRHSFLEVLKTAERPMIILGMGALAREDGSVVWAEAARLAETVGAVSDNWNGFNVLHTAAGRVGGLDVGFVPGENGRSTATILDGAAAGDIELVWLMGADEIDMDRLGKAFVVYQGSHGDAGANRADVILPGATYTEKDATYVNMEGRPQAARRAAFPPGDAKDDWAIVRAFSEVAGHKLPFDNLDALREQLFAAVPHLQAIGELTAASWPGVPNASGQMGDAAFVNAVKDFYLTNPITRASRVMAECSSLAAKRREQAA